MRFAQPIITLSYKKDELTFYEDKDDLDAIYKAPYFLLHDLARVSRLNEKKLLEIVPDEIIRRYFDTPNEQQAGWFVKKNGFDLCLSFHRQDFKFEIWKDFEVIQRGRCDLLKTTMYNVRNMLIKPSLEILKSFSDQYPQIREIVEKAIGYYELADRALVWSSFLNSSGKANAYNRKVHEIVKMIEDIKKEIVEMEICRDQDSSLVGDLADTAILHCEKALKTKSLHDFQYSANQAAIYIAQVREKLRLIFP